MTDKKDKKDKRERLVELLSPNSKNFLGTGLSFEELSQLVTAEKIATSWALQPAVERKRRRSLVIQLAQELGRVQEQTNFATRLAEMAIEAVIEGDWAMVKEWAEHFAFDTEDPQIRDQAAPPYAVFRELLLQALRTDKEPPT